MLRDTEAARAYKRQWYLAHRELTIERSRRWGLANPEAKLAGRKRAYRKRADEQCAYYRRRRYGLSDDGFERLATSQERKCAICVRPRRLGVDHDHQTGNVRGLLCIPCNRAIAAFDDSKDGLLAAMRYFDSRRIHILQKALELADLDWTQRSLSRTERYYFKKYGFTPPVFEVLKQHVGPQCLICRRVRTLHVEHDHQTNQVRGMLCISCNRSLAALGDNHAGLANALRYFDSARLASVLALVA